MLIDFKKLYESSNSVISSDPINDYNTKLDSLVQSRDENIINKYFNGLMEWNAKTGKIKNISINLNTDEKLVLLRKYQNEYQYNESPTEPTQNSKCLNIGRKSNICIEISTYYDYLEYLLNKLEYILLDDETISDENNVEKISYKIISMQKFR